MTWVDGLVILFGILVVLAILAFTAPIRNDMD